MHIEQYFNLRSFVLNQMLHLDCWFSLIILRTPCKSRRLANDSLMAKHNIICDFLVFLNKLS